MQSLKARLGKLEFGLGNVSSNKNYLQAKIEHEINSKVSCVNNFYHKICLRQPRGGQRLGSHKRKKKKKSFSLKPFYKKRNKKEKKTKQNLRHLTNSTFWLVIQKCKSQLNF